MFRVSKSPIIVYQSQLGKINQSVPLIQYIQHPSLAFFANFQSPITIRGQNLVHMLTVQLNEIKGKKLKANETFSNFVFMGLTSYLALPWEKNRQSGRWN